jgi:hypothetical protein
MIPPPTMTVRACDFTGLSSDDSGVAGVLAVPRPTGKADRGTSLAECAGTG